MAPTPIPQRNLVVASTGIEEADRVFAQSNALDYSAPMTPHRRDLRTSAIALYTGACKAGDKRACWLAPAIAIGAGEFPANNIAVENVARNCRSGNEDSCRALAGEWLGERIDLAVATRVCKDDGDGFGCYIAGRYERDDRESQAMLVRGCEAEYPRACSAASRSIDETFFNRADKLKREQCATRPLACSKQDAASVQLATVGCERGIIEECLIVIRYEEADPKAHAIAARQLCAFNGWCPHKIVLDLAGKDLTRVRDAYEHSCQLGSVEDCRTLKFRYRSGELPEPVSGRGAALEKWLAQFN